MERTRQRLSTPYLAFFRGNVRRPELLLKVHWVTSVVDGSTDVAACGKWTRTHQWFAFNDAQDMHLRRRMVACIRCCESAPDQFSQLPRSL